MLCGTAQVSLDLLCRLLSPRQVHALRSGLNELWTSSGHELSPNVCKRRNFHCGRLLHATQRVARREAFKFVGFVLVVVLSMTMW